MRALERFLVVLALISLIMRIIGLKDAPTLELISFPALALFYLSAFPFLLFSIAGIDFKKSWKHWALAFASGLALAYCVISLLCYTLDWIKVSDILVNGSLLCGLLVAGALWGRSRKQIFWMELFWRVLILWIAIVIVAFLPLPEIGSLSRGSA